MLRSALRLILLSLIATLAFSIAVYVFIQAWKAMTPAQRVAMTAGLTVGFIIATVAGLAYAAHETLEARIIELETLRVYNITARGYERLLEWLKKHDLIHHVKPLSTDARAPGLLSQIFKNRTETVPVFFFWRIPMDPDTNEIEWDKLTPDMLCKSMFIDVQRLLGDITYVKQIEQEIVELVEEVNYLRGHLVGLARIEAKKLMDKFFDTIARVKPEVKSHVVRSPGETK